MAPRCPLCGSEGKPLTGCEVRIGEEGPVVTVFSCTNPTCYQECKLPHVEKPLYYPTQFVPLSETESVLSYPDLLVYLRDKIPMFMKNMSAPSN